MTRHDIPELIALEKLCFDESWTKESYENELKNTRAGCYLVCRHGERFVGYVGAWLILDEAHITTVAVEPELRGAGIGKFLVWHIFQKALKKKCRWATLEVSVKNKPARNLYEQFGFKKIGVRRNYYANGEDAVVMWLGKIDRDEFKQKLEAIKQEWEKKICWFSE